MYYHLADKNSFCCIEGQTSITIDRALGLLSIVHGNLAFDYEEKYIPYVDILNLLIKQPLPSIELFESIKSHHGMDQNAFDFIDSLISSGIIRFFYNSHESIKFHKSSSYGHFEQPDPKRIPDEIYALNKSRHVLDDENKHQRELPKIKALNDAAKTLHELLNTRVSTRQFNDNPMDYNQFNFILWAACGLKNGQCDSTQGRTIPSAGGIYPINLYLLCLNVENISKGLYQFNANLNRLILKDESLASETIQDYFITQHIDYSKASVIFFTCTFPYLTLGKYGNRGYRYILLEAGHIAQNICLAATACKLHSIPVGGFKDDEMNMAFNLSKSGEHILYSIVVGT